MKSRNQKSPISKKRVFDTAVRIADTHGVEGVSMRKIAAHLGIEAMSLYHYVKNKDEILAGMVDTFFTEIDQPSQGDWKSAMRKRAISFRKILSQHPWAITLLDSRRHPGPATLTHHEWVLARLRKAGFSVVMAAHAFSIIDSYVYGFVLQESSLPYETKDELDAIAKDFGNKMPADKYPHIRELTTEHVLKPDYSYANEFLFGLDLILDGLHQRCK